METTPARSARAARSFALAASQTRAAWVGAVVAVGVARGAHRRLPCSARTGGSPSPPCVALAVGVIAVGLATPLGRAGRVRRSISTAAPARAGSASGGSRRGRSPTTRCSVSGPRATGSCSRRRSTRPTCATTAAPCTPTGRTTAILDVTLDGWPARRRALPRVARAGAPARVARRCARAIRSRSRSAWRVLAYVVQQQFLFPLAELDPIFWVLVGMLVARTPGAGRVMRRCGRGGSSYRSRSQPSPHCSTARATCSPTRR